MSPDPNYSAKRDILIAAHRITSMLQQDAASKTNAAVTTPFTPAFKPVAPGVRACAGQNQEALFEVTETLMRSLIGVVGALPPVPPEVDPATVAPPPAPPSVPPPPASKPAK